MIDDANTLVPNRAVAITGPDDMAHLLRSSCPEKAAGFARAAHERACWAYDESRTLFWERVVVLLGDETELAEQVAA